MGVCALRRGLTAASKPNQPFLGCCDGSAGLWRARRRHTHSVRDLEVWSERAVPTPTRLVHATGRLSRRSMPQKSGCAQTDVQTSSTDGGWSQGSSPGFNSVQCRVWDRRLHRARAAAMAVEVMSLCVHSLQRTTLSDTPNQSHTLTMVLYYIHYDAHAH